MKNNEARTLKEALYQTIHKHYLPIETIAEQIGMATSYLYRACLEDTDTGGPEASGVRFPLKKLIPLIRCTGNFQVLDYIERTLGRVAIMLPQPDSTSIESLQERAINAAAEFGELMLEIRRCSKDGKLTEEEIDQIHREGYDAVQAIMQLITICDSKVNK